MKKTNNHDRNILITGLVWIITYIACLVIVREFSPPKTAGFILSFLPAIAFVVFITHYIRGIKSMDELERTIQLESAVVAFTLSLVMIMVLGLLDQVTILKKEDWSYRHLVPYFFTFYFVGLLISRRKYHVDEKQH